MSILLPEHRQIELYTKKKVLAVVEDPEGELAAAGEIIEGLARTFTTLDAALGDPVDPADPMAGWRKYLALPRKSGVDKLTAEIYRTLRIFQVATAHPTGRIDSRNGLAKASSTVDQTALSIRVTRAGRGLLDAAVAYRLAADTQVYPEAYVEAMLCRYWADIVAEIRWYYDEDRVLFQFRDEYRMNRHFRFDCDNPRFSIGGGKLHFSIGEKYADPARYPIDFFVIEDGLLHIVPVEALTGSAIALDRLPRWRARVADGVTLPAAFRPRFTREEMTPGLPMT
ncbi:hypothetical protein [Azospirillum sp. TSO22-1]|uniref:hypothetical protein n=1 Tax=Azospirillum sp. TSO22-1 TaxID=716789 RepID=UPI000D60D042|nr:hypothetical protein [Azospirillum sp. TSO22-1]PWC42401.1 hypothetical protein TSO221_21760 [Azospirillum sp. TSO22-1]